MSASATQSGHNKKNQGGTG